MRLVASVVALMVVVLNLIVFLCAISRLLLISQAIKYTQIPWYIPALSSEQAKLVFVQF
jgi:hypothetical protein